MACGIERKRERKICGKHKHLKWFSEKKVYSINAKFRCHDGFSKLDACNRISGSAFRVSFWGMITLSGNYSKQFRYLASFRQAKARFCHRSRESVALNFPPSFLESTSINCHYIGGPKIFQKEKVDWGKILVVYLEIRFASQTDCCVLYSPPYHAA